LGAIDKGRNEPVIVRVLLYVVVSHPCHYVHFMWPCPCGSKTLRVVGRNQEIAFGSKYQRRTMSERSEFK
jgi:hypothetical protein